jgi:hypothetical protein
LLEKEKKQEDERNAVYKKEREEREAKEKALLNELKEDFKPFDITYAELPTTDNFAFPDAVIFANDFSKKETIAAHNYVNVIGNKLGKIKYLNIDDINVLKGLDSEKYRKTL